MIKNRMLNHGDAYSAGAVAIDRTAANTSATGTRFRMARKTGRNLRRHVRIEAERNRPIRIDINGLDFIDVFSAADISESGIGIVVPHRFENCRIEQEISLVVTLPEPTKATMNTRGRIRHVTEKSFGVEFINLSATDRTALRRYIAHRLKEKSIITRIKFWLGML